MSILRKMTEKPWLAPGVDETAGLDEDSKVRSARAVITGLVTYFAVATVLFSLIAVAYLMRMGEHVMAGGTAMGPAEDWLRMPEPPLLWLNTFVLVLSSVAWEAARLGGRQGRREIMRSGVIAGGAFALLFLLGQLALWQQYYAAGYVLAASPAYTFFYLIATLHGLHLLGGLLFWARAVTALSQGVDVADVRSFVEPCALYWHFLLLVWLAMFGLLLTT